MAKDNTLKSPSLGDLITESQMASTTPKPSLSDTNARDSFIAAALKEIVSWQLAESKINHDMAGVYAVRYANSAMVARASETAPLNVVVSKGAAALAIVELAPATPEPNENKQPPKSIAEIIGDAEPVAEVK